jgi:hypothetical protein
MKNFLAGIVALLLSVPAFAASNVLTWDDMSTNETGFSVERKPEACTGLGAFGIIGSVAVNVNTFTDASVVEGVTYCYRVRATGGGGLFSAYSNSAERLVPFTAPAAPSGLTIQGGP